MTFDLLINASIPSLFPGLISAIGSLIFLHCHRHILPETSATKKRKITAAPSSPCPMKKAPKAAMLIRQFISSRSLSTDLMAFVKISFPETAAVKININCAMILYGVSDSAVSPTIRSRPDITDRINICRFQKGGFSSKRSTAQQEQLLSLTYRPCFSI